MLPLKLSYDMLITKWKSVLDPIVSLPILKGLQLSNVELVIGANVINHKLGRIQQGWLITDIDGAAQIYRSADFNSLTMTLTSDANVTVSLWVY